MSINFKQMRYFCRYSIVIDHRPSQQSAPVGIRQEEQEAENAEEVGVVVPGGLVQQEHVPVWQKEQDTAHTEGSSQHDTTGT